MLNKIHLETSNNGLLIELLKGASENSLYNINQYRQLIYLLLEHCDLLDPKSFIGFYETKIIIPNLYDPKILNQQEEK